ncbi:leucine--tRNA ligase [Buchnera aphidicola]|uniref:leucine--tRNA ligase n=1 Tax=Buchnera aphidicola TaxID=9 RepID=UPI003464D0DC
MEKEYSPKKIEPCVQKYWKDKKTFHVYEDNKKEKYYCLPMLPYPSGKLHMGHVRNYTISDVIARYQRMLGKNVLQPIGWDAFGLPAEEAAIKNNSLPSDWTDKNIKYMKKQLQSLGFSYDWSREITTSKPNYYRWEQWFFTKLYKKKLVYKKNSFVNWCPYDKTVLANEQVIRGCCWRCQNKIITKKIPQWFIKIRKYAESLYNDLNKLENWPEKVKNMQKNWIGRLKGFEIIFNIFNSTKKIKVFVKKLDKIMGEIYISISPFHKFSKKIAKEIPEIKNFIKKQAIENLSQEDIEKTRFEGINSNMFAIHPITNQKIPIWIANFVLKEYGTKAVISIPEDNQNDLNFSIKNNLDIKYLIKKDKNITLCSAFENKKNILFNSENVSLLDQKNNILKIHKMLSQKKIIKKKIIYKLQDWCISRQRYWGAPIPMATTKSGKIIAIPEKNLPIVLPKIKNDSYSLQKSIYNNSDWTKIKIGDQDLIREVDTFDTFMESSWYYARYTCPNFNKGMIDPISSKYWLPVDQYIGGIEHATMHLIYFRFYHKLLRDFKLVQFDEPVKNLLCQGMVLSKAFYQFDKKKQRHWIHPSSVKIERNIQGDIINYYNKKNKKEVIYAGMIKMSKSKNNGIEPEIIINRYGADTIRLFMMFAAPIESSLEWRESGVKGIYRFLKKIWKLVFDYIEIKHTHKNIHFNLLNKKQKKIYYLLHKTIFKVSDDIGRRKTFNTAISAIMELVNKLIDFQIENEEDKCIIKESLLAIIKMLYPFTPHFCFILWKYLNKKSSIDHEKWPVFEKKILFQDKYKLIVQINGKKIWILEVKNNLKKEEILLYAKNNSTVQKKLENLKIKKIIYIHEKVINFIT